MLLGGNDNHRNNTGLGDDHARRMHAHLRGGGGAIPLAVGVYGLSPMQAYLISVFGNLLPVIPLLLFLGPVSDYLRRFSVGDRFFTWLFARTRNKHIKDHERFGLGALAVFVAVPLPMTGAWTGCAIAFLLGFRFWPAFAAIASAFLLQELWS